MSKPLVYIAGPYTNPDPVENVHRAIKAGMDLYRTGQCAVIIPHLSMTAQLVEPHDVDFWYEFDLTQLAHCDALFRLPGDSTGADNEVAFAIEQHIPVFALRSELYAWLDLQAVAA